MASKNTQKKSKLKENNMIDQTFCIHIETSYRIIKETHYFGVQGHTDKWEKMKSQLRGHNTKNLFMWNTCNSINNKNAQKSE